MAFTSEPAASAGQEADEAEAESDIDERLHIPGLNEIYRGVKREIHPVGWQGRGDAMLELHSHQA